MADKEKLAGAIPGADMDIFEFPEGEALSGDGASAPPETETEEDGQHLHHRRRLRRIAFPRPDELDDVRLMELLLFEAMPRCDTNETAKTLLEQCGGYDGLIRCGPEALAAFDALGEHTSVFLQALSLLCRRYIELNSPVPEEFDSLRHARRWMRDALWPNDSYEFISLSLDADLKLINIHRFGEEGLDNPYEYARDITRDAITENSGYLFLAVTHPGGLLAPSRAEVRMLIALSDLCLHQHTYLAETVILCADGAKFLSESPLFPIGTFLQFENTAPQKE